MSPSELSLKIAQQSSELPNISKCCHMIKTALGVLNTQHSTIATKRLIKKYISQRFKLNVTCVSGEFENKISKALRRMLATQEIVYIFGLFKLNSNGTEANNKGSCNLLKKYDSFIWTAANALDNENGFSWQDILKYMQDTNKLWSGGLQSCSKSMVFMVEAGLINLVRGVLGKPSAHFELAKTHTSEEDPRSAVKRKRNSLDAPDLNKWTVIHSQRDEAVTREFVSSLIKVTPSLGMKWSKPRMVSLPDHKPSSYETALDQVLAQNPQIVMAVIPANKGDHYTVIKKKCSLERPISPIPSQVVTAATLVSQARGLMSVATTVAVQMNNKLGGGGETLPPELILTNITEHGPRPAAARVTWDRGNTGDTYDWKRQRKRHRGEEEDEDVVVSETSDEED